MIAECDLPFAFVKKKSFRELIHLLNKEVMPLVNNTNQVAVAMHVGRLYCESKKTIKKQVSILFTQDVWTSPMW
jgi:hypothetical protein